jgi:hypothetical protein
LTLPGIASRLDILGRPSVSISARFKFILFDAIVSTCGDLNGFISLIDRSTDLKAELEDIDKASTTERGGELFFNCDEEFVEVDVSQHTDDCETAVYFIAKLDERRDDYLEDHCCAEGRHPYYCPCCIGENEFHRLQDYFATSVPKTRL